MIEVCHHYRLTFTSTFRTADPRSHFFHFFLQVGRDGMKSALSVNNGTSILKYQNYTYSRLLNDDAIIWT
jgi:hypothetical protein